MARTFAGRMGDRVMRVCLLENQVPVNYLRNAITFLKPSMVVIDDFDRIDNAVAFLDFLEKIRKDVRLLVVTTNDWASLPRAVRRPGRFDEVFTVECLGRAYLEPQTGPTLWKKLSAEQQKAMETWPSAYIKELRVREELFGDELDLATEYADLVARMSA